MTIYQAIRTGDTMLVCATAQIIGESVELCTY